MRNRSIQCRSLLVLGVSIFAAPNFSAQEYSAAPNFKLLRQDEDWSAFPADAEGLDSIKHVKLSADGEIWVSFGGSLRVRFESWEDFAFGTGPAVSDDDDFVLTHAFVHADLHLGDRWRIFTEGKTAQSTDRNLPGGRRTLDMDTLALQQFFAETDFALGNNSKLRVRAGRQMFAFGKQRLVSPLPWANAYRSWDGLALDHFSGPWHTTGFFSAFNPVDKTDFNERDSDQLLYGIYSRRKPDDSTPGFELYWLGTTKDKATFNGTTGSSQRHTFGSRIWEKFDSGVDIEAEAAWQGGKVGEAEVHAAFAAAELGWKPEESSMGQRYFVGLDWASGDRGTGGDVRTFDQLFPLGHAYLGFTDFIGRQNVIAATSGVTFKPAPELSMRLAFHAFWVDDRNDAIYNPGGAVLRAPGSFRSSRIGQEVDLTGNYSVSRNLNVFAGYAYFNPGGAIEDSGSSRDVDFVYVGASYRL